jgi:hypothetical protein
MRPVHKVHHVDNGGGGGIRTHETFRSGGFQDRSFRPLTHSSMFRTNFLLKLTALVTPAPERSDDRRETASFRASVSGTRKGTRSRVYLNR